MIIENLVPLSQQLTKTINAMRTLQRELDGLAKDVEGFADRDTPITIEQESAIIASIGVTKSNNEFTETKRIFQSNVDENPPEQEIPEI